MIEIVYLDSDERELVESIENAPTEGELLTGSEAASLRDALREAVQRSTKDAKITLRLPKDDLLAVKAKARELGVNYQPLIAELIHQFATGKIRRAG